MFKVAFLVELMRRAFIGTLEIAPRGIRPDVHQQRPNPQPQLRRALMPVQAPIRLHQATQQVHRPIHRVARPMASGMVLGYCVGCRDVAGLVYPVGMMLVGRQMQGNRSGSRMVVLTRLFRPSLSMRRYQNISLWPKPILSSQGGAPCDARSKGYANSSTVLVM
jgi:hypothetical protein